MQKELKENPLKNITYEQLMERAVRRPWYGPYREVLDRFTKGFETIITNPNSDCDAVLKQVQEDCQKILDNYYM